MSSYYDEHKDERLEYQKMYHNEHKDKYLKYQRDYYETVLRTKREHIRRNKPPPLVIKVKKEKPPLQPKKEKPLIKSEPKKVVVNPFIVTFT